MQRFQQSPVSLSLSAIALAALAACGGGGGSSSTETPPGPVTVSTTVIDGALSNALVCLDENGSGTCDSGEISGRTDAAGKVSLSVPADKAGKVTLLAIVGTDAVDAVHGPVTTAYTLSAPADQTAVISPLTTLVQRTVADSGAGSSDAAKTVQAALGLTSSPLADYTQAAAPTDGSADPTTVARLVVVTVQEQLKALAAAVGTNAGDGRPITQADVALLVQRRIVDALPDIASALASPAVQGAADAAAKAAALAVAAQGIVAGGGLTAQGVATAVAAARAPAEAATVTPAAFTLLNTLTYTDAGNWFVRVLSGTTAQNTPDASGQQRYVDRRMRSVAGKVAKWNSGGDPTRQADLHWNGGTWVACGLNAENKNTVRNAQGVNRYNYCDGLDTGSSQRSAVDISGQGMAAFYASLRAAGYTGFTIANADTALGSASFPAGSTAFYQVNTSQAQAISYQPGGVEAPVGSSTRVTQYIAEVAQGGTASAQAPGTGCNHPTTNSNGSLATTLEGLIAAKPGTPCTLGQGSFTYAGSVHRSDVPNVWWGNSTVSLGRVGTAALNSGATAPGYYSGNTNMRASFATTGNGTTYYACKERFTDGSPRNCSAVGTGTYTIATLGDARVLTFNNLPTQTGALTFNRVLVERGGAVYSGFQTKVGSNNLVRLNRKGTDALLTQLGVPTEDPDVPMALTATSYQGTWDLRDATTAVGGGNTSVTLNANGTTSCFDRELNRSFVCSVTVTDPTIGAFSFSTADGSTAAGNFQFLAGTASGTYNDPTSTPTTGNFVGARR
ncbi:conserved exported hypothetical protein [Rubrivivax sp. A210]|uniref:hypothetical protein n=1 Tax=Rubrivivax sp. A210 TaxID=2772301 RepID=UPI001919A042|nr:hypothetical protein [Rubrivivax sp. A210]CAD5373097.1 conserved exported hypothetical protein [Rubrivivax sp. A210]